VIHKQQIIIAHRAIFEVELSFEGLKFFIVIRRTILNKVIDSDGILTKEEKKSIQREIRKSNRKKDYAGGPFQISPSPNEQLLDKNSKLFTKIMWVN
jgi:hypothetical protein